MSLQSFEGTWEDIQPHINTLVGHRVRVTVLDDATSAVEQEESPFVKAISLIEAARQHHAGQRFSDSTDLIREDRDR